MWRSLRLPVTCLLIWTCLWTTAGAASVEDCRELLRKGHYADCISLSAEAIQSNQDVEDFSCLKAQAEFTTGQYKASYETLLNGLVNAPASLRLRWLLVRTAPYVQNDLEATKRLRECHDLIRTQSWRYSQKVHDLVTLAEVVLHDGADPKQIQTVLLKRARELHPESRVPLQAIGNLALEKRDMTLATETFQEALKKFADDPDLLFGLACALNDVDPKGRQTALDQTLASNPKHIGALLMQAEQLIDAERYELAKTKLDEVLSINAQQPIALAYSSVLAFLRDDLKQFEALRNQALSTWDANPEVDYQLGKKLSQKYRFVDGAAAQRRALMLQSDYRPAQRQLAQDLLRLGQEEEGWQLAHTVYQADQYDVGSYNLVTLHDELRKYTVIERTGWRIRMEKNEASIYGDHVVALLEEARKTLCQKYEIDLKKDIFVEIFPKPSDFAVRTFGMPGAGGYLGVCFGDVITALSPATREASPVNWESVLWHEFAHVVTLNKTHNRMPRWLSEGISVYEERQRDSRWGERMAPAYRDCILAGKMTPIHRMSEAFLPPGNSCGIMFAYFQSSLVVEYLIETYGQAALVAILEDLAVGVPINDALERHTTSLGELEQEFSAAMRLKARYYGWYVDWSPFKLELLLSQPDPVPGLLQWARRHPRHYNGLKTIGQMLLRLDRKQEAKELLEQAVLLYPLETGAQSASALLAELQRDSVNERDTLLAWTSIDNDSSSGLLRLIELDLKREDWSAVMLHSRRLLEIKPLLPQPYSALALASEKVGENESATSALKTLLKLPAADPADLHYRLAAQYKNSGELEAARRETLKALEIAPRYRDALSLLLELQSGKDDDSNPSQN